MMGGSKADARRLMLSQMLALLRTCLDPDACRHQLFEVALGDGTAIERCTCADVPVSRRCSMCSASAADSEWVAADDWVPDLVRIQAAVESRESARSPGLLRTLRAWRHDRKGSMPRWKCDALLAHAMLAGAYSLDLVECEKVHRDVKLEESQGRQMRTRWELAATMSPSGVTLALTSLDLALVHLHRPSLDPAVKSFQLASAACVEANRRQVAAEGSEAIAFDDYEGGGAEGQEGHDSEDEEQYWSSFMDDDDAAASDAASIGMESSDDEDDQEASDSGTGSDQEASDSPPGSDQDEPSAAMPMDD